MKYTKELHEQWRKDSGNWKNSFHPDAIVTLLDEIERLQKVIYDLKYPECSCGKYTGLEDYYILDEGDYL